MNKKPKIGVIGFSDGEPEVHEELKGIVQEQMDAIVKALRASGEVDEMCIRDSFSMILRCFFSNHQFCFTSANSVVKFEL